MITVVSSSPPREPACCGVCGKKRPHYKCPRCRIDYCSVACYRQHNDTANNNGIVSCTEQFYEHRVRNVLDLEAKERKQDERIKSRNLKWLNKIHRQEQQEESIQIQTNEIQQLALEADATTRRRPMFTQKDLHRLYEALEYDNQTNESSAVARLFASHPNLRKAVEHDITLEQQHGALNLYEWFLQPWYPWWQASIDAVDANDKSTVKNNDDDNSYSDESIFSLGGKNLDELLLQVPKLNNLVRSSSVFPSNTMQQRNHPDLRYNLVDILYGVVYVFRLYHGPFNASDEEVAVEAVGSLLRASMVLQKSIVGGSAGNFLYASLEEVLMDRAVMHDQNGDELKGRAFAEKEGSSDTHESLLLNRHLLLEDVATLCRHPRFVARALFEACHVLCNAVATTLPSKAKTKTSQDTNFFIPGTGGESVPVSRTNLRKLRKKLEFYVSWNRDNHSTHVADLARQISEWILLDGAAVLTLA